jgi:hypothetical protein
MNDLLTETSRFSTKVTEFLQRVTYSLALTQEQKCTIYRLRYDANLKEQTIVPNPTEMLRDRFDDAQNGFNVGVYVDGRLAAALRLHLLSSYFPDSPLVHAYPDLVEPRVQAGLRIVDITRLAADFAIARSEPYLAYATVRLSMLMCQHFDADIILAAVRREHIPFYKREFLATQLSEPRPYPTLVKPLCLFEINFKANQHAIIGRHPFHASSAEERANLFGPPHWPVLEHALDIA